MTLSPEMMASPRVAHHPWVEPNLPKGGEAIQSRIARPKVREARPIRDRPAPRRYAKGEEKTKKGKEKKTFGIATNRAAEFAQLFWSSNASTRLWTALQPTPSCRIERVCSPPAPVCADSYQLRYPNRSQDDEGSRHRARASGLEEIIG